MGSGRPPGRSLGPGRGRVPRAPALGTTGGPSDPEAHRQVAGVGRGRTGVGGCAAPFFLARASARPATASAWPGDAGVGSGAAGRAEAGGGDRSRP